MTFMTVQPFGLEAPGGGPRILRSLFAQAPVPVLSVISGPARSRCSDRWREISVPPRPSLGRLEGSRYGHWGDGLEIAMAGAASRKLRELARAHQVEQIHAVAHSASFWPALVAARQLQLPYLLTVHDDLRYLLRRSPLRDVALDRLGRAWRDADARFVISSALGDEYCRRYGERPYSTVTDGLMEADFLPPVVGIDNLLCYFAGLFHRGYRGNLRTFLGALDVLAEQDSRRQPRLTCRCGSLPDEFHNRRRLRVVDFGSEAAVRTDIAQADLLYLPLMFEPEYADMIAFSLSTKLVTYLGAGRPILYHGPPGGAAYELLAANDAAIMATSTDPEVIARAIIDGIGRTREIVANAQDLARRQFMLDDQRERFWAPVTGYAAAAA